MGPHPFHYLRSTLLSQEKSTHQNYISIPAESQVAENPHGYYEGHRDMDGQEPLGGESPDIKPPVSKRDIQDENN